MQSSFGARSQRPRWYRQRFLCALLASLVLHLGVIAGARLFFPAPASVASDPAPGEPNRLFIVSVEYAGEPLASAAPSPPPTPVPSEQPAAPPATVEPARAATTGAAPPPSHAASAPADAPPTTPAPVSDAATAAADITRSEGEPNAALGHGGAVFNPARAVEGHNPTPKYPRVARQRGWQGTTVLRVQVLPDGRADAVQVAQTSGYRVLDEASTDTVRQWRFHPARFGDAPVSSWVEIHIRFQLLSS
jgi:protein TonB